MSEQLRPLAHKFDGDWLGASATGGQADEKGGRMTRSARDLLDLHLASWLGEWPPGGEIVVTTTPSRSQPCWDGSIVPLIGVGSPEGTVVSVLPAVLDRCIALVTTGGLEALGRGLAENLPFPAPRLLTAQFRWCEEAPELPDAGEWLAPGDPAAPGWIRSYQEALVASTPGGCAGAVGIKHHDPYGHELAIQISARVASEQGRGGLGRQLITKAARKVLADGALPTAILNPCNVCSDRLCAAGGFPNRGWQFFSMVAGCPTDPSP